MRPAHWQKIRHPKQPEILASHTAMPKSHEPPAHSTSTRRYRSNSDTELMQTRAMAAEIPSPPACEFFLKISKPSPITQPMDCLLCFPCQPPPTCQKLSPQLLVDFCPIIALTIDSNHFSMAHQGSHLRKKTQVAAHSLPSAHQNVALILQHIHCMCKYLHTRIKWKSCSSSM